MAGSGSVLVCRKAKPLRLNFTLSRHTSPTFWAQLVPGFLLPLYEHHLIGGLVYLAGHLNVVGFLEGADARACVRSHHPIFRAAVVFQIIERLLHPLDIITSLTRPLFGLRCASA